MVNNSIGRPPRLGHFGRHSVLEKSSVEHIRLGSYSIAKALRIDRHGAVKCVRTEQNAVRCHVAFCGQSATLVRGLFPLNIIATPLFFPHRIISFAYGACRA